jgi:hypothetical protein
VEITAIKHVLWAQDMDRAEPTVLAGVTGTEGNRFMLTRYVGE